MVQNNIRFNRADQLTQHLTARCLQFRAGERFLSVRQIMDEFNVSQITVKQAMERLCETGVLEAQERRGYFVRREPRYRKIVCLTPSDIADYLEELSSLLKEEAEKAGFESSLVDMPDNASGVAMLPKLKADAVLFIPYAHEEITPEQLNRIMAQPMPVIITYGTVSVRGCRYVDGDNEFSGVLAATYLLMNGHRKLGILVSEPEVTVIRQRLDGFLKCARACGVEVEVLHPHIEIGESSPLRSYEFFKQYLSEHPKPGFTGLFVVSMFPAREVIRAANECGLEIPRDFSLISLGRAGHKAGEDITRINTRRDLVVSYAVRLVKDYFEHKENTPMFHIVPTEIHQGNTVRNIGFPQ